MWSLMRVRWPCRMTSFPTNMPARRSSVLFLKVRISFPNASCHLLRSIRLMEPSVSSRRLCAMPLCLLKRRLPTWLYLRAAASCRCCLISSARKASPTSRWLNRSFPTQAFGAPPLRFARSSLATWAGTSLCAHSLHPLRLSPVMRMRTLSFWRVPSCA